MKYLPWVVVGIAIVSSGLYGAGAVKIFTRTERPPWGAWSWHQRWLNFLGSIVGWLVAWLLFVRHCGWPVTSCGGGPDWWDVAGALTAFIGMAGYLPATGRRPGDIRARDRDHGSRCTFEVDSEAITKRPPRYGRAHLIAGVRGSVQAARLWRSA